MANDTILWRRLDAPGHEASRCYREDDNWHLVGTAVFALDARPSRLDYAVTCNAAWQTVTATVNGWVGDETIAVEIEADAARRWWRNGIEYPELAGSADIDLNFSPATNLLPIRRMGLSVGQAARVRAAWLRFPDFTLAPLDQCYRRLDSETYRYESAGGAFTADLKVNAAGFVTLYPDYFQEEPAG